VFFVCALALGVACQEGIWPVKLFAAAPKVLLEEENLGRTG